MRKNMRMESFMEKLFPDKKILAKFKVLEKKLCYQFRNIYLLDTALTHRSFTNENPHLSKTDNERLEFLGDAVLALSVSDLICNKYPIFSEGALTKIRASLVNEKTLAQISRDLEIGEKIFLGQGEEKSGGRNKSSILANTLEAVFAAIYLDSNFKKTDNVIKKIFEPLLHNEQLLDEYFDYKSDLQDYCQKFYKKIPVYTTVSSFGPEHNITFEVLLTIDGILTQTGTGKNKKEAEKQAAQKAWRKLQVEKSK